ncbi:glycosyltransferase [Patescibacteria group bacterium]|nr:glycosyltransferase [Patescibacteria group bacterium]
MKICLVNSLYKPYTRGGAEVIVNILAEYLSNNGHTVYIITSDIKAYSKPNILREKQGVIEVYRLGGYNFSPFYSLSDMGPFLRLFWHYRDIKSKVSSRLFKDIIEDIQPDLIWCHNLKGLGYGLTGIAKKSQAKFWLTLHDVQYFDPSGLLIYGKKLSAIYTFARSVYTKMVKKVIAMPDLLISPSQWLLDLYKSKNLFTDANSIQILNPITELDNVEKKDTDELRIMFSGQLEVHKGILTLLEAIKEFNSKAEKKIILDIWGRGSLREQILIYDNVQINDWPEFNNWPKIMSNYDLAIVPSLCYENSPTAIRIAKTLGLSVIGSNIGGIPELLDVNNGDYLFEPGNVKDLLQQLEIFANRKLSHKLRSAKVDNTMSVRDYWETLSAKL